MFRGVPASQNVHERRHDGAEVILFHVPRTRDIVHDCGHNLYRYTGTPEHNVTNGVMTARKYVLACQNTPEHTGTHINQPVLKMEKILWGDNSSEVTRKWGILDGAGWVGYNASMRKPEQEMWDRGVKPALDALAGVLVYARHEDRVTPGTPDIDYAYQGAGWIEMKRVKAPRRENGKAPIRHLTEQQIGYLQLRGRNGAGAWVLVQVDEGWNPVQVWCPEPRKVFYLWGYWQLHELRAPGIRYVLWEERAVARWVGKVDPHELAQILAGHTRGRRV